MVIPGALFFVIAVIVPFPPPFFLSFWGGEENQLYYYFIFVRLKLWLIPTSSCSSKGTIFVGFSLFLALPIARALPHALRRLRDGLRGSGPDAEEEDGLDAVAPVGGSGGALFKGDIDDATLLVAIDASRFLFSFREGLPAARPSLLDRRIATRARVPPQRRNLLGERVGQGVCGKVRRVCCWGVE